MGIFIVFTIFARLLETRKTMLPKAKEIVELADLKMQDAVDFLEAPRDRPYVWHRA